MKGEVTKLGRNHYRIRFSLPRDPSTGKRPRPTRTIHGAKKDAEKVLREWIRDYELGKWTPGGKLTLNQHMDEWFKNSAGSGISEHTLETYRYDLERFIRDTLGKHPIEKIRTVDIQNLFLRLVNEGAGPTSVKRLRAALSKCFKKALLWNRVYTNPVVGTEIPGKEKVKRRPPKAMTAEQANAFLEAAAFSAFLTLFEVALSTGMRPGELFGLPWLCIDWENSRIRVEQAVVRVRGKDPRISKPKTKASYRSIPVPPKVMESLREHRKEQNEERLLKGPDWSNQHGLVFPNPRGEIWNEQVFKEVAFWKVQERAGLSGFNPYSLRHTCATLLLAKGIHPKIVSERLGHSSIQRTLDVYSHVFPTMQETASAALNELLFSAI